ncbi:hypothetical protein MHBO_001062 [Bonamia ostreae]|uniref:Uncharacterized protein n=1 Tax=Bonamia ostreae TaxID=126728 RepID=A0ABV2AID1_9EUKA
MKLLYILLLMVNLQIYFVRLAVSDETDFDDVSAMDQNELKKMLKKRKKSFVQKMAYKRKPEIGDINDFEYRNDVKTTPDSDLSDVKTISEDEKDSVIEENDKQHKLFNSPSYIKRALDEENALNDQIKYI